MHKTTDAAPRFLASPIAITHSQKEDGRNHLAPKSSLFMLGNRHV